MQIEFESDIILQTFSKEESEKIRRKWMALFCKNRQGLNTKDFKWHIFSGGAYPSLEGKQAMEAYEDQQDVEYLVMGNNDERIVKVSTRPSQCNLLDFYVFPINLAWTMAFTHEEGWLGPYFAKHPEYKSLNLDNLKAVEKEQEKERAREKGWS